MTKPCVMDEIAAERKRQIEVEGWTAKHDDKHAAGELALAAACYASVFYTWANHLTRGGPDHRYKDMQAPFRWPWALKWWKPKTPRRDLIRAAALIVAEIERIDRNMP